MATVRSFLPRQDMDRIKAARSDERGIALQTVIIMVVLVMIGGAVAGVLVSRAGQETSRLEDVDTTIDASRYGSETLCELAGYTWLSGACTSGGGTPSGEGDGPGAGTFQARWTTAWATSDAATTWVQTKPATYDTGEADDDGDPATGTHRTQWSNDGGSTWTATKAAYDAGE